jgi:hypothetical protein
VVRLCKSASYFEYAGALTRSPCGTAEIARPFSSQSLRETVYFSALTWIAISRRSGANSELGEGIFGIDGRSASAYDVGSLGSLDSGFERTTKRIRENKCVVPANSELLTRGRGVERRSSPRQTARTIKLMEFIETRPSASRG